MLKPASRVRPDTYEAVFGALAHPARRRVLLAVYFNGGAMTAGEIAAILYRIEYAPPRSTVGISRQVAPSKWATKGVVPRPLTQMSLDDSALIP